MMFKRDNIFDAAGLLFIMIIGAAELTHICGLFLHRPVAGCAKLFGVLAALVLVAAVVWHIFRREKSKNVSAGKPAKILLAILLPAILIQAIFLAVWATPDLQGDMSVEIVGSFLHTNSVYSVHPLTGGNLGAGIPNRLKILGLPTLYASLCKLFGITPYVCVTGLIPVIVLLFAYAAFACLSRALFSEDAVKRIVFLLIVSLLFWVGLNNPGSDGYRLLAAGFAGTTIRNLILVPLTVGWSLRGKYMYALLCVVAEACIVWTLYGLGVCAVIAAVLFGIRVLSEKKARKEDLQ